MSETRKTKMSEQTSASPSSEPDKSWAQRQREFEERLRASGIPVETDDEPLGENELEITIFPKPAKRKRSKRGE